MNAHFYLHHSPFQQTLSKKLVEQLTAETLGNPLQSSTVLVRNQGMATWLKQQMATSEGIAMHIDFPQPHAFLSNILHTSPIPPEVLLWKIFAQLQLWKKNKKQNLLLQYLTSSEHKDQSEMRCYQLSGQIAQLFDTYFLYRPEWMAAWSQGEALNLGIHESWQKELWSSIAPEFEDHWSQYLLKNDSLPAIKDLPPAIHVFGFSNFAPIYSRFLYLLSHQVPVHIYWLNPVDGYWGDSPNKKQWLLDESFNDSDSIQLYHPLLVHLGKMGREFVHTIYDGYKSEQIVQEQDLPETHFSASGTQLEKLQQSLRDNLPLDSHTSIDNTISIHSCHSPLRELERLKDYLYQISETDNIDTSDIIVMCPSIDDYISSIHSVFGRTPENNLPPLPYRIADQLQLENDPDIKHLLSLLQLTTSRCTNAEVINALNHPSVLEKYNLTDQGIDKLKNLVELSGIRWGLNQEHVDSILESKIPAYWHWSAGLERMVLGSTLLAPKIGNKLWKDILPVRDIEGQDREILTSIYQFIHHLIDLRSELSQKYTLHQWVERTHLWIETFFVRSDKDKFQTLLNQLENILTIDDTPKISFDLYFEYIQSLLRASTAHYGFLSGNITFCEMKPMRAIPSKIICLLGMNQDTFPRQDTSTQFDLMKIERQSADRSIRDDDAYAFLESLISARSHLYLSYIGRSSKDNSKLEPSTVVQTLIKHCPGLAEQIQEEKLHSFDSGYFTPINPISYSSELMHTASRLHSKSSARKLPNIPTFDNTPPTRVSIEHFIQAFTNSAKHFLINCVEAQPSYLASTLEPNEPIDLNGLDKWKLKHSLLYLDSIYPELISELQLASEIPPFKLGEISTNKVFESHTTVNKLAQAIQLEKFEINFQGHHIYGQIPICTDSNTPHHLSASKAKFKNVFITRIYQLIYSMKNASATASICSEIDSDSKTGYITRQELQADPDYTKHFQQVYNLFLQSYRTPLNHFPETSAAYFNPVKGKDLTEEIILKKRRDSAYRKWKDQFQYTGEESESSTKLIFPNCPLFTKEFLETGATIWEPIFSLLTKG